MYMGFLSTIIVVEDVMKSRTLYEGILKCKVSADFGVYNVGFEGGLSLYKKTLFQELVGNLEILDKSNNFVVYFEVEDLDELEKEIKGRGFSFVHSIREQPWGQRTFRFYDYDNHMLEIGETMTIAIQRMYQQKKTVEEIAQKTGYSLEQVLAELKKVNEISR
jgi:catechol 2,3-dioxygenase-like lactoylglutathione lyase family enzyme